MDDLVLHPTTAKQLALAVNNTIHAYLLVGPDGLGKTTVANKFAVELIGAKADSGNAERWIYQIGPVDGKKISIAQVKQMAKFANQSKSSTVRVKAIIIDQANNMSTEAANSLLLLLEDPPPNTVFILIASSLDSLATTIVSRLQIIRFYEPNSMQMAEFAELHNIDSNMVQIIGNLPAQLIATKNDDQRQLDNEIVLRFMDGDLVSRLMLSSELKEKAQVDVFLRNLARQLVGAEDELAIKQSESLLLAQSHLYNSGNPKFVLENLALEFE